MNPAFNPREVVKDCAESRALIRHEYTLEVALTDARFYRSHPEVIIDGQHAKRVIETFLSAYEGNGS